MKKNLLQCFAIASIFVLLQSCATMAGSMNSYNSLAEMEKKPAQPATAERTPLFKNCV